MGMDSKGAQAKWWRQRFSQHVLNLSSVGRFPAFVASPRAMPPTGLRNRDYTAYVTSWLAPERNEAAFCTPHHRTEHTVADTDLSNEGGWCGGGHG